MDEHIRILELAEKDQLPDRIDETSSTSVIALKELLEAGYMEAIDASSADGPAYLNPRITLAGRKYLKSHQVSWFLRLKNRPWEWIFSGIGVFAIGWLVTWLWDGEPSKSLSPNITASNGSIISGGNTTATASAEGSTAIVATGPVTVNQRDPLVSKALEVLTRQLEAKEKQLIAYLNGEQQDQMHEALFQKQYQELKEAIEAIPKLTDLPNAQVRIEKALSEAARGNSKHAEAIFLEVEKRKIKEGQEYTGNKTAAEAARHRGALALLRDPSKALEAYRRANELNPDKKTERLVEFSQVISVFSKLQELPEKLEHKVADPRELQVISRLAGENLRGDDLRKANLVRADLREAYLSFADLSEADLSFANLSGVNLRSAKLSFANLSKANLSEANLGTTDLSGAILHWTDLSGAILSGAILHWTDLSGAILSKANLSEADLSFANLSEADLHGANLSGAILSEARNPTQAQIDSAFYCEQLNPPKLPAGLELPLTQECDESGEPI